MGLRYLYLLIIFLTNLLCVLLLRCDTATKPTMKGSLYRNSLVQAPFHGIFCKPKLETRKCSHWLIANANRCDTATTTFDEDGRIRQIEYAYNTVEIAGTCIGMVTNEGIVLAAERLKTERLLDETIMLEKIHKITDNLVCAVAGVIGDANVLLNEGQQAAQMHLKHFGEPIPCEDLVSKLCDVKQAYTQFGGKRPFGVALLYMGWDRHHGYQLYSSHPGGTYSGWKAVAIGKNHEPIMCMLNRKYKEGKMTLKKGQELIIECLRRSLDRETIPPEKVEFAVLTRIADTTDVHIFKLAEVAALLRECKKS